MLDSYLGDFPSAPKPSGSGVSEERVVIIIIGDLAVVVCELARILLIGQLVRVEFVVLITIGPPVASVEHAADVSMKGLQVRGESYVPLVGCSLR